MSCFDASTLLPAGAERRRWVVTGVAGFIGSNIAESLLAAGEHVRGVDNFATGHRDNIEDLLARVDPAARVRFDFAEADIADQSAMERVMDGATHVLHQAALGSVPRSIENPLASNQANITGFLTVLDAARRAGVERFVYAASSSTYGDEPSLPKREDRIGNPLSPYAVTKYANELYASVYWRTHGLHTVGLRYFNVFGKRQDPDGAYAAVIPRWIDKMIGGEEITIFGDGETTRDFCFVDNAVQANIRAALAGEKAAGEVYNVAAGGQTSLNQLFAMLTAELAKNGIAYDLKPSYDDFRAGDVRHSLADISKAAGGLGYAPTHDIGEGLACAMSWYIGRSAHKTLPNNREL